MKKLLATYKGLFFAHTKNGTDYWFKNEDGGNFVFNSGLTGLLATLGGENYSENPNRAFPTQREELRFLNPMACR